MFLEVFLIFVFVIIFFGSIIAVCLSENSLKHIHVEEDVENIQVLEGIDDVESGD